MFEHEVFIMVDQQLKDIFTAIHMNLLTLLDVLCLGANDAWNYISCGMTVYQMYMYYDGILIAVTEY
jgi:hypothetical protein